MHFLYLIRYKNLLIIGLTQWLFKWILIDLFFKNSALSNTRFIYLILATICIAAAGNIINDIQDVSIDRINKPEKVIIGKKISEKTANWFYILLNIIGVALGFYVASVVDKSSFAVLFVLISGLLYYYSVSLKKVPLAGNILISILVALTVLIVGIFTLLPIISDANQFLVKYVFKILFWYSCFAFYINLLRELIKDIEDVNGDYTGGVISIPIVIGKKRTVKLVSILSILPCSALFFVVYEYLYSYPFLNIYLLFAIMGPLLYVSITAWSAKKKKEYTRLSTLLKLIMVLGVLSIIVVRYTLFQKL
ncbi:geranylgeranylglycerol-phosphate geranylgeranyltransferase [Ascidiimonas sp. W6]|uniref:geranylgeranylglycerol-phosphate geranylgeranyltransferase n=1 Tax=Ascidiimonas meishanensis TaxID=3128903 RepID=UPI0030EE126B